MKKLLTVPPLIPVMPKIEYDVQHVDLRTEKLNELLSFYSNEVMRGNPVMTCNVGWNIAAISSMIFIADA